MSRIFLTRVSRRARFCSDSSSWSSNWSRLDWSHPAKVWSISVRWESIIPINSWILLLSHSAWSLCFWISDLTSARICSFLSFKENPDSLVFQVAFWFSVFETNLNLVRTRVSPYLYVWKKKLSWQQTFFMRVISLSHIRWFFSLLSEQWWRWRFSDELIVEFRIVRERRLRVYVDGFILEERCKSIWVVEVVEVVGLVTCERVVYRHGTILLILRVRRGSLCSAVPTTRRMNRMKGGEEIREAVEALEREEEVKAWRDNAQSDTWWHVDERSFMKTRRATPWAMRCMWTRMKCVRENYLCEGVEYRRQMSTMRLRRCVGHLTCADERTHR